MRMAHHQELAMLPRPSFQADGTREMAVQGLKQPPKVHSIDVKTVTTNTGQLNDPRM
jgi:hypothetical protein